jgi:hypothetical protein
LINPEQLAEEGAQQVNCAATYAAWIENGCGYVYRVLRPERATVAIQQGPDGNWEIQQIRAKGNDPVTEATAQSVEKWLRAYSVSV